MSSLTEWRVISHDQALLAEIDQTWDRPGQDPPPDGPQYSISQQERLSRRSSSGMLAEAACTGHLLTPAKGPIVNPMPHNLEMAHRSASSAPATWAPTR
jgi:hypothetical protein